MITEIYVDGFRSLKGFSLEISPGLNLLVGANGAGKTNIISFFDFLSNFSESDAATAISESGGANSVFSQEGKESNHSDLEFIVTGVFDTETWVGDDVGKGKYEYTCRIRMDRREGSLRVFYQRIKIYLDKRMKWDTIRSFKPINWHYDVERQYDVDDQTFKYRALSTKAIKVRGDRYALPFSKGEVFHKHSYFTRVVREDETLIRMLMRYNPIFIGPLYDMRFGRPLNISPAKAKEPNDFARDPVIHSDGSGLAATLHKLQDGTMSDTMWSFRRADSSEDKRKFQRIQSYFKLVNRQIERISIEKSYELGCYIGYISLKNKSEEPIKLPLTAVSDGTAKWLAITTALISGSNVFSIEEPENFLHPYMQIELISLIRETINRNTSPKSILITTHSETVLNRCLANEIIVCRISDSRTIAIRHPDAAIIQREVDRSGFGLSYFYLSGSFDD